MIRGFFPPERFAQPFVQVLVQIPSITERWVPQLLVIDTGASITCIHATDATTQFGMATSDLDPRKWVMSEVLGGIGGGWRYITRPARYAFPHDDGQWTFLAGVIRIGELQSEAMPAAMGWDLLQHFELHISGPNKTATLGAPPST